MLKIKLIELPPISGYYALFVCFEYFIFEKRGPNIKAFIDIVNLYLDMQSTIHFKISNILSCHGPMGFYLINYLLF